MNNETVQEAARRRLTQEEAAAKDARLRTYEAEEAKRREREERELEREEARSAAREREAKLAAARAELEERAERELAALLGSLREVQDLDGLQRRERSAAGMPVPSEIFAHVVRGRFASVLGKFAPTGLDPWGNSGQNPTLPQRDPMTPRS